MLSWKASECQSKEYSKGGTQKIFTKISGKLDRMNGVAEYARNGRKILALRDVFFHSTDIY